MARTIGLSIACLIDPDVAGQIRSGLESNAQRLERPGLE